MLIRPEKPITPLPVNVVVVGETITASYPERHTTFKKVVSDLDYRWQPRLTSWRRVIDPQWHGTAEDRLVELVIQLLNHGFLVDLDQPQPVIEKIASGTYLPECRRWIRYQTQDPHMGWFILIWGRSDDLYAAARRIAGSHYHAPHVIVPPAAFRELRDFAERYQFRFSPRAQEGLVQAQQAYEEAILITPKRPAEEPVEAPPTRPAAIRHDIDPEFRDEAD